MPTRQPVHHSLRPTLVKDARLSSIDWQRLWPRIRQLLVAAAEIDVNAVDRDIEARRLEAAVGLIWAEIKDWLAELKIKPGPWCMSQLRVSSTTMDRRLRLHRYWPVYEDARRKAGVSGNTGLTYAMLLIRIALRATKRHGLPSHPAAGTGRLLPHEHGTQRHHNRLKIATFKMLVAQDDADRIADELVKHDPGSQLLINRQRGTEGPIALTAPATMLSPKIPKIST